MMSMAEKFLDQDLENIRRAILGYCSKVLLNNDNPIAAVIIENFSEPYYDTGKAGFVYSVYSTLQELKS